MVRAAVNTWLAFALDGSGGLRIGHIDIVLMRGFGDAIGECDGWRGHVGWYIVVALCNVAVGVAIP